MQFDGSFAFAEAGPREHRKTQIDGGGIERVDRLFQFHGERLARVQSPGLLDQDLSEIGINLPIPILVGMGQRAAGNSASNAHVVESACNRTQRGFDIPQTLAIGQLGEDHAQPLLPTGEVFYLVISSVALNTELKLIPGDAIHQLGKDCSPYIHRRILWAGSPEDWRTGSAPPRISYQEVSKKLDYDVKTLFISKLSS